MRFPLPAGAEGPIQIYLTPDESRLYVCDQGLNLDRPPSNKLYELDLARGLVSATIEVGLGAHGVVVDERGERVFVTNMAAHTVSVVEVSGRRTIATLPVGQGPSGIAEWHVSGGMR